MKKKIKKIYIFGDSICTGQLISPNKSWVNQLDLVIEKILYKEGFILQNASVNGNTTRQALDRMYYDVTSHLPDYVLIQFGLNDCNSWKTDKGLSRVSKKSFVCNLEEIIEKCFAYKVRHIFLCTNHPTNNNKNYDKINIEYSKAIQKLFKKISIKYKKKITLVDNFFMWSNFLKKNKIKLANLLLSDGVHLNIAGHKLYEENNIPLIINKLKKIHKHDL
jgi:lysophospholipase L1-like esterase